MVLLARAKNFIQTEINRYEGKNSCRSDAWKIISQRLLKKIHRELITSFPLLVSPSRLFDYSDIVVISLKKKKRKSFAIRYICVKILATRVARDRRGRRLIALISKHNAFKLSDYIGSIEMDNSSEIVIQREKDDIASSPSSFIVHSKLVLASKNFILKSLSKQKLVLASTKFCFEKSFAPPNLFPKRKEKKRMKQE